MIETKEIIADDQGIEKREISTENQNPNRKSFLKKN
jgi:hypothetical protein